MKRISEMLRDLDISGFKRSGIYKNDVERFCNDYARITTNNPFQVGLRLAFGDFITAHTLTDGVCKKIINTKIETLPVGRPAFLKSPFLLEAKQGECLLHDIHTIGGYIDEMGTLIIISYFTDTSFLVQIEQNSFSGIAMSDINFANSSGEERAGDIKNRDTLPFITILALMMEAERTPLSVSDTKRRNTGGKNATQGKSISSGWVERRIYIDARYKPEAPSSERGGLDKDGKILKNVRIQGFLRNQPYGPGHKLRKWIYVEGFESSRWARTGDTRIIVDIKK